MMANQRKQDEYAIEKLKLIRVLQEFEKTWAYFPVSVAVLFMTIAHSEEQGTELGVVELGQAIGMSQSSVSRNIKLLSDSQKMPGSNQTLDLVELRPDSRDYRKRIPSLTQKGRAFYNDICATLRS